MSDPSTVDLLFSKARTLHEAGELSQAETLYRKLLQNTPKHSEALHFLGVILWQTGRLTSSLQLINKELKLTPHSADAYYSQGNALYLDQQYQAAVDSYDKAILLNPMHAEAYHNRGSALNALLQYKAALESYDHAISIKPDYEEAHRNHNRSLYKLQHYQMACNIYNNVLRTKPGYEYNKQSEASVFAEKKVERIAKLRSKAKINTEINALPFEVRLHPAVCNLRMAHFIKQGSSGKDLVFYCGPATEIWNPHTAETKGIGGSEEAVIWLSNLLHKRGWNVTVYANCGIEEESYDGVYWKPYWMWNLKDKQDVTIIWRYPQIITNDINSDKVMLDLHDTIPEYEFTAERLLKVDKIFVKSTFHRSLYPTIPEDKFIIIPNGIDANLFESNGNRDSLLLINTSSADRSLPAFLDCFEQIKKHVPQAKARWAYGWGVWDFMYSSDALKMEWKTQNQRRMKELGVEECGRLNHSDIARLYLEANIFAYPSEMAEIDCISLSKAMAAGAIPITTDFAAMGDKSAHGGFFIHSNKTKDNWLQSSDFHFEITDPEQKTEFVKNAVELLLTPPSETDRKSMRDWATSTFDWDRIADLWNSALNPTLLCNVGDCATESVLSDIERSINPALAEQYFARGNELYGHRQYKEAMASYCETIHFNSQHAQAYNNRGSSLYAIGQYQEALENYKRAIQLEPKYAEAYFNRGNVCYFIQDYQLALESYTHAIKIDPNLSEAYCCRGNTLFMLQQYQAAIDNYDKTIRLNRSHAEAYNNRGSSLLALDKYQDALNSFNKAIGISPGYAEAYCNRGNALFSLQQYQAALESFDRGILLNPNNAKAHCNRGNALYALQKYEAALESQENAILIDSKYAEAYYGRGNVQYVLQCYQQALESYSEVILLDPKHAESFNNRASCLHAIKSYHEALDSYDKAISLKPDYAEAYCNRSNTLNALQQHSAAVESCDMAIALKPDYADAHFNRGNTLYILQQYQAAVESYDRAILLNPLNSEAYCHRGSALHIMQRYQEALESFDNAIRLKPDYVEAHCNRGQSLLAIKQYYAALESFKQVLLIRPDFEYLRGTSLHMKRFICDWENIEEECRRLEEPIDRGEKAILPFTVLAIYDSLALQRKAVEINVLDKYPPRSTAAIPRWPKHDKIRIGYFSADFYNHATSYLMAELFELHDRTKFEVIGFTFGPNCVDEMSTRVSSAMDQFFDVSSMTDKEIAQLSRELEIDIAIDLKGFTRDGRAGIFAERVAPIQINYIGYPGTMGADYIDYLIADPMLIPKASQKYYSEKIVCLPDSYQVNDSHRVISTNPCSRADEGLPESGFVFCCFSSAYKISPAVFDIWMRILKRVEGSVLWLMEENPWMPNNLRKEASRRGVAPERLIFAKLLPLAEHLNRQRLADLFLDSFPYNAHTTTSDALWASVPVVTRMGETFASRVAASLLRAIDLPELITSTEDEYENLAVELACNSDRLQALRQKLQQNRLTTPLFDTPTYTRHLEAAYSAILERFEAGLPPDHIYIPKAPPQ